MLTFFTHYVVPAAVLAALAFPVQAQSQAPEQEHLRAGVEFRCSSVELAAITHQYPRYMRKLGIDSAWYRLETDSARGTARYTLTTPVTDTSTLDFAERPQYGIRPETLRLPAGAGKHRDVSTASKKEIALALMQHGRLSVFSGDACRMQAFEDHIGVRQNIAAWAETLSWGWPDGGAAAWNKRYWKAGTPRAGVTPYAALQDAFFQQQRYSIGCYTATKLVVAFGVLDYYHRVRADQATAARVVRALLRDGDPLVHIEPQVMWAFEPDFDEADASVAGKLLELQEHIAPDNFIPGDWAYLLNTDPLTYQKTGYEGSNAIYLGRNRFDDYYNDHGHSYSFEEKVHEVYQWRHGVFSRVRDAHKVQPLGPEDFARLSESPAEGGLLMTYRAVPRTHWGP